MDVVQDVKFQAKISNEIYKMNSVSTLSGLIATKPI